MLMTRPWSSLTVYVRAGVVSLAACERAPTPAPAPPAPPTFAEVRAAHTTQLTQTRKIGRRAPTPPPDLYDLVTYTSPAGKLEAYVSKDPGDGKKHPLIIWRVGGFANSISELAWTPGPPENDQSATSYHEAGILMMHPSLRGGNDNPGYIEGNFGEVDDVIAAAEYAAKLPYVDPSRIYLGGHSVGGTLALLAGAAAPERFRAVFSLGPATSMSIYGQDRVPYNIGDDRETKVRTPTRWMKQMTMPVFVIEGEQGYVGAAKRFARASEEPGSTLRGYVVPGHGHFDIVRPVNQLLAQKILADTGDEVSIELRLEEITAAMDAASGPRTPEVRSTSDP